MVKVHCRTSSLVCVCRDGGGIRVWERLVRSVKTCLWKVMGRASLSFEELSFKTTHLCLQWKPQLLMPTHVSYRKAPLLFHDAKQTFNSSREELTQRWKYRQRHINNFWTWKREYLLELRSTHTRNAPRFTPLKEGDLVLIGDNKTPRQIWKTVMIKELFSGKDGLVRPWVVRTLDRTILRRPVQLLYPLETV